VIERPAPTQLERRTAITDLLLFGWVGVSGEHLRGQVLLSQPCGWMTGLATGAHLPARNTRNAGVSPGNGFSDIKLVTPGILSDPMQIRGMASGCSCRSNSELRFEGQLFLNAKQY
jgi:hypothetical protein